MSKNSANEFVTNFDRCFHVIYLSIPGTTKARQSTPNKLDVSYGSLQSQKFDIYGTELGPHAPILLWIHGGYWQEGSKDASGHFANILHSLGFRFIVLGYTLAPNGISFAFSSLFYRMNSCMRLGVSYSNRANILIA